MKKQLIIIVLIILLVALIMPTKTYAKETSTNNGINTVSNYVQIAAKNTKNNTTNINGLDDNFGKEQNCNSLLGDPSNDSTVAWLLITVLNYLRVLGPLAVVVLSGIEFTKTIVQSDDDTMKKAKSHLVTRLILVVVLFLIPTFTKLLLQLFNVVSDPMCGIK